MPPKNVLAKDANITWNNCYYNCDRRWKFPGIENSEIHRTCNLNCNILEEAVLLTLES